jgi:hypothetical protein
VPIGVVRVVTDWHHFLGFARLVDVLARHPALDLYALELEMLVGECVELA